LIAYESDRAVGCSFGNEDFQNAIKRMVNKGECFKAYPTCFCYTHIPSIISMLRRTNAFRDIIYSGSNASEGILTGDRKQSDIGSILQSLLSQLFQHVIGFIYYTIIIIILLNTGDHVDYSSTTSSDMMMMISNRTRHAIRVKLIAYPEQICAIWVIVAVCYMKA